MTEPRIYIPRYDSEQIAGLPTSGYCVTFTQSEVKKLMCPRQWLYAHVHGLEYDGDARPLRFGSAFHAIMEDLHRWFAYEDCTFPLDKYLDGDCLHCEGKGCELCDNGKNLLSVTIRDWEKFVGEGKLDPKQYADDLTTLRIVLSGYLRRWGLEPDQNYKVVGVELQLAMPVVHPVKGEPFKSTVHLVEEGGRYRFAKPGEAGDEDLKVKTTVGMPWYFIGKMDALMQNRTNGSLMIREHKTSGSPRGYLSKMEIDPQIPSYSNLVKYNLENGTLKLVKPVMEPTFKGDMQIDLAYSGKLYQPKQLKNGSLSKAKAKILSFVYADRVEELGLDMADYEDHIESLMHSVDHELFIREQDRTSDLELKRNQAEFYAFAAQLAGRRRMAAEATCVEDLDIAAPRMPVCMMGGGFCSYKGVCSSDSHDNFTGYKQKDQQTWKKDK
jgi:hypothetical protein